MPDERLQEDDSADTSPLDGQTSGADRSEPDGEIADALARVQAAVADRKNGELQESLEAAIEAIDSARETPGVTEGDKLATVADAFEEALDELEEGKVANLLPIIEQVQSVVSSGSSED